jgi:hypothetical protein
MGLRTALDQSKLLTFVALGAFVWLLLTLLDVAGEIDVFAAGSTDFVGFNATAGIAGIVVLAVVLGVLVALYSEITETDPAPETWPPSE